MPSQKLNFCVQTTDGARIAFAVVLFAWRIVRQLSSRMSVASTIYFSIFCPLTINTKINSTFFVFGLLSKRCTKRFYRSQNLINTVENPSLNPSFVLEISYLRSIFICLQCIDAFRASKMKHHQSPSTSQSNMFGSNSSFRSQSPLPPPATTYCLSATSKSYKYLRKLVKFDQMDFEFAMWQMVYLFISPQKLYRNFSYRKRKCDQPFSLVAQSLIDRVISQRQNHNSLETIQPFQCYSYCAFLVSQKWVRCHHLSVHCLLN